MPAPILKCVESLAAVGDLVKTAPESPVIVGSDSILGRGMMPCCQGWADRDTLIPPWWSVPDVCSVHEIGFA